MSDQHAHDVSRQVKIYICVFLGLLVFTILTVALHYANFSTMAMRVSIALFIAVVKALLVAGFFMHLIAERKAIYAVLVATFFFFGAMMYLTVYARGDTPRGTVFSGSPAASPTNVAQPAQ